MGLKLSTDLHAMKQRYRLIIEYVNKNLDLLSKTRLLKESVNEYIHNMRNIPNYTNILELEISPISWVWSVHKLNPIDYHKYITGENVMSDKKLANFLIKACCRQATYVSKIYEFRIKDIVNKYPYYRDIYPYFKFLRLVKRNDRTTIVPTIEEDFNWHAHMQDYLGYRKDTIKIFGEVLNHNDNLPEDLLRKYTIITNCIRNKHAYCEKKNLSEYHNSVCAIDTGSYVSSWCRSEGSSNFGSSSGCGSCGTGDGGGCGGD